MFLASSGWGVRDAAKHPSVHRTPHNENCLVQDIHGARLGSLHARLGRQRMSRGSSGHHLGPQSSACGHG